MSRAKRKKRRPLRRQDRPPVEQLEIFERMLGLLAKQIQDSGARIVAMAGELKRIKRVALIGEDDDG
jgi:hypothetical protein